MKTPRRYGVRLKIGNRFGAASKYTLREVAVCLLEQFSITDREFNTIVDLHIGETTSVPGMRITRLK